MSDAKAPTKLNKVDKAAILLLSLGETDAAQVLRHLGPKEVQRVGVAMAQMLAGPSAAAGCSPLKNRKDWCGRSGSNRHSFRNRILSPARLPVSPRPHVERVRYFAGPGLSRGNYARPRSRRPPHELIIVRK